MILVALAVVLAAMIGIASERRFAAAQRLANQMLRVMLYALVPFVSYVNIAHLPVTVSAGVGIAVAWVVLTAVGFAAFAVGRFALRLPDEQLGALICTVVVANSGYLGLPMAVALLRARALGTLVAYDQLVSGPALPLLGFGVGAAFGGRGEGGGLARLRSFAVRNPP